MQDIVSGVVCAVVFFAVSYPMAVYSGQWITFKKLLIVIVRYSNRDPDIYVEYYNLDDIIPSIGATAVSCYNIHHRNLSKRTLLLKVPKVTILENNNINLCLDLTIDNYLCESRLNVTLCDTCRFLDSSPHLLSLLQFSVPCWPNVCSGRTRIPVYKNLTNQFDLTASTVSPLTIVSFHIH